LANQRHRQQQQWQQQQLERLCFIFRSGSLMFKKPPDTIHVAGVTNPQKIEGVRKMV